MVDFTSILELHLGKRDLAIPSFVLKEHKPPAKHLTSTKSDLGFEISNLDFQINLDSYPICQVA